MNSNEKDFLQQTRKLLDDSADSLDAATLSRLNQARHKALQHHASGHRSRLLFSPVGTVTLMAGFAVAAIAVVLWTVVPQQLEQQRMARLQQYEDMEMLLSGADLELLEDMEFISWLVDEDTATQGGNHNAG